MVEGFVVNLDQQITNQRWKQFYVIADYKNPDGIFKRARLHIHSVVAGPVLVTVPLNIPATAPLLTATKLLSSLTILPLVSLPIILLMLTLFLFQQPPPLMSPLHFFQQTLLPLTIVLLLLPLHLNQQLSLPSLPTILLLLTLNLIKPLPRASMPILILKMPLYLIQLHLLKMPLYLIQLHLLIRFPLYLIHLNLLPVLLRWLLVVM